LSAHTDRELLELAAKAAGYDINFEEPMNGWYPHGYDHYGDVDTWWNPIKCDGDALRLACDLGLRIFPATRTTEGHTCSSAANCTGVRLADEIGATDVRAATRRAIVRAAALIGRSKP